MIELNFRPAEKADLAKLVEMLAADELGRKREDNRSPINPAYIEAFNHIIADPNNELVVVEHQKVVVGMLQLTFIPYLTHIGSWRCLIEGVRIHSDYRGEGLGSRFFTWAIDRAKQRGCKMVQLTSDKQRPDAIRFYLSLGFSASHEGFKMVL